MAIVKFPLNWAEDYRHDFSRLSLNAGKTWDKARERTAWRLIRGLPFCVECGYYFEQNGAWLLMKGLLKWR